MTIRVMARVSSMPVVQLSAGVRPYVCVCVCLCACQITKSLKCDNIDHYLCLIKKKQT